MQDALKIPLDLVDDPRIAMRETTKDESIDELMADMKEMGLIQPIVVRPVGDRYEIIAGHRRTTAARLLNWATIPAVVREVDDDTALQMRTIENLSRKDVDPVDEACYIAEIMTRTHKSVTDMAKVVHRSEQWVEQRLEIFEMPTYLKEFLKQKKIPLGAALELTKIDDENAKREYCFYAATNGVSVATAKRWKETLNAQQTWSPQEVQESLSNPGTFQPERKVITCARCAGPCYLDRANSVFVHPNDCSPETKGGLD